MGRPRLVDVYLKVKDMDRAIRFYEVFLGITAQYRYQDRWVSITDDLGLYNPAFDLQHDVPMTPYDREWRMGNNVVVVFSSDDIEGEHQQVGALGATGVTDIVEINLVGILSLLPIPRHRGQPDRGRSHGVKARLSVPRLVAATRCPDAAGHTFTVPMVQDTVNESRTNKRMVNAYVIRLFVWPQAIR